MGPRTVAEKLMALVPEEAKRSKFEVLDVAAGTGRVGLPLTEAGFRCVDALGEPSSFQGYFDYIAAVASILRVFISSFLLSSIFLHEKSQFVQRHRPTVNLPDEIPHFHCHCIAQNLLQSPAARCCRCASPRALAAAPSAACLAPRTPPTCHPHPTTQSPSLERLLRDTCQSPARWRKR